MPIVDEFVSQKALDVWKKASEISAAYGIEQFADLIVYMQAIIQQQADGTTKLNAENETLARRAASLDRVCDIALDIVQDLARCGGYDHKGKNEGIIAVISRLMANHSNYAPPGTKPAKEDVSF